MGARTTLSEEEYRQCMEATTLFLTENRSIRNRELRKLTDINYDQAIAFFNRAISEKTLRRQGQASGTHYILTNVKK